MRKPRRSQRAVEFAVLEARRLMCGVDLPGDSTGMLGTYPVVSNVAAASTATASLSTVTAASSPLSAVPAMHSNPGATAKLYLDFVGAAATSWGTYSVPATPAYDTDGDATTFSASELSNINEIWSRIAEK